MGTERDKAQIDRTMEQGQGTCQMLPLTLTMAILLLRCKLFCQKVMEKMGLLVLCVFGESPRALLR
jgi:hypothetical protein